MCVCTRVHAHEHRGQREPQTSFIRHNLPLFFSERQGLSLDWNSPSQRAVKPDFKYVCMCACVRVCYMCICTYQCTSSCARMWKPEYFRCPTLGFIPLRQASLNETGARLAVSQPQQSHCFLTTCPQHWGSTPLQPGLVFYVGPRDLNSGLLPCLGIAFNMGSGDQTQVLVLVRTITLACHYPSSAQQIKNWEYSIPTSALCM